MRGLAALREQPASSTTASDPSRLTARSCPSLTCPSDPWPLQAVRIRIVSLSGMHVPSAENASVSSGESASVSSGSELLPQLP